MALAPQEAPGLTGLLGGLARTGLGALQNRCELLALEWQEERLRLTRLLFWAVGAVFLALMAAGLLTLSVILLLPEPLRLYGLLGFCALYLVGALAAALVLRSLVGREPFAETLNQLKEDRQWLQAPK